MFTTLDKALLTPIAMWLASGIAAWLGSMTAKVSFLGPMPNEIELAIAAALTAGAVWLWPNRS